MLVLQALTIGGHSVHFGGVIASSSAPHVPLTVALASEADDSANWWQSLRMSEASAPASPEALQRYQRILREAVDMFGADAGSKYMTTANFALGGRTPAEMSWTEEGARQVLNELAAQEGGGPL